MSETPRSEDRGVFENRGLKLKFYAGTSKTVEFTEEKGLTRLYVNRMMQDCPHTSLHRGVEVCVEAVEALKMAVLGEIGVQDLEKYRCV